MEGTCYNSEVTEKFVVVVVVVDYLKFKLFLDVLCCNGYRHRKQHGDPRQFVFLHSAYTFGKVVNPVILQPVMGK